MSSVGEKSASAMNSNSVYALKASDLVGKEVIKSDFAAVKISPAYDLVGNAAALE